MKYRHNQICTKGSDIEVGKQYCYKEDSFIAEVIVVKDSSDDKGIGFDLKVVKSGTPLFTVDQVFGVWATTGHYAYSGMWMLFDSGAYHIH